MTKLLYGGLVFAVAIVAGSGFSVSGEGYEYGALKSELTIVEEEVLDVEGNRAIVFVGDVLLARKVERYMERFSHEYPFMRLDPFRSDEYVVANFESSIPSVHVPTPFYSLNFSTKSEYAKALRTQGFTHVSLANNHSYDTGHSGFMSTTDVLTASGLTSFGVPGKLTASSTAYVTLGTSTVALIGLETLSSVPTDEELKNFLGEVDAQSDLMIVYIHWGNEYALRHSKSQEVFAEKLVSLGVDAIVGHHPHVVQDIALIDGVPVFYSLGNFVFDQYFSPEVQQGLQLTFEVSHDVLSYSLTPVTSIDMQSSPRPMTASEKKSFLTTLANRSDIELRDMITDGKIVIPR